MDLPLRRFAVTAEIEITVFHDHDGYTAHNDHVIACLLRVISDHQSSALLFCGVSILSAVSLSAPCQRPWAHYRGMLMLIELELVKIYAALGALISQMNSVQWHKT